MQSGLRIPPGAPAAATLRTATPSRTCLRGHGPAWPAWFGALLRRLREREEILNLGPRERRDARLTDYDVRMLARKPLWRPWTGASPRGGRRPADEGAR
jgi:hypothetical protein